MSWTQEQVSEVTTKVIQKASTDAAFREVVLNDVYAAVKEVSGQEVPRDFKINVIDGAKYHANIVLPAFKASADELSETELESVAGGSKSAATDFFNGVGTAIEGGTKLAIDVIDAVGRNK
ncbi:MAG: NHLP leader peptide family RiPP precursor [Candidatus Cohnella colombiensis]|uniref:NHLP leader peptide family RiPP n=1 Tax=Candidatus Cohnella colombiensis TaxID=3121368 RepID=A0AA95JFX3_9BACL|nr:MAG: NHLP leader peptide family RiPP precursor [Cohnella sp.]